MRIHEHYVTMAQAAQRLERGDGQIREMVAFGELAAMELPGCGALVPLSGIRPFTRPSEENEVEAWRSLRQLC